MLRAVPSIVLMAASTLAALRSGIFFWAISLTWSLVSFPTLFLFGVLEPLARPMAFLMSTAAGGVLVINVNDLSAKTVITTGVIVPSSACVLALNALQNSMILTPCWPRAGPMGGGGFA